MRDSAHDAEIAQWAAKGEPVTPRPGGETDKFGNRYEGAWTIRHALYVLLGRGESLTVEANGLLGEGVEFAYHLGGRTEVHQVKRQNRNANSWNVASLGKKEIWRHLRTHAEAGHDFHFVSVVPARPLQELSDRARRSNDYASFIRDWLTEGLRDPFDELASPTVYGSPESAWHMLRALWVEWPDERDVVAVNATLAEQVLSGAPGRLAALGLGDLLLDSLGTRLDTAAITARLPEYGLRRVLPLNGEASVDSVSEATRRWAASVERELFQPIIPRQEAVQLAKRTSGDRRLTVLMGSAGDGKSAVLHQAFTALNVESTPVLAFRLDRLDTFSTTTELGRNIGLTTSPVTALAAVANERPSILIVDQLDAVSVMSGRIPETFDAVADLVREASAHPTMRVVLACRKFDVDNDHRIRQLTDPNVCTRVIIDDLTDGQLNAALGAMGLNAAEVGASQRRLLRSPLHLVLLASVADQEGALSFRTIRQLFDTFWNRKRKECLRRNPAARFHETVTTVAEAISTRQRLSVPHTVLDGDDLSASGDVLISEHVLVRDGQHLAFFHESFFDYAFARGWLRRRQTLVAFLTSGEQELFRRGQVRQILGHLRELEPERFVEETEALLMCQDIRYHIKEVALALLRDLDAPTAEEWDAVARILDAGPAFLPRLVYSLSNAAWFSRADAEGAIEDWLTGHDPQELRWALRIMSSTDGRHSDRLAELLAPYDSHPEYSLWLMEITRFTGVAESRQLFDLILNAVRTGQCAGYERALWVSVRDLGEQRPGWAVELLAAHLTEQPDALRLDDSRKVIALLGRDHIALRLVKSASVGAPAFFCARLLPVLLGVMEATAHPVRDGWPVRDGHFAFRYPDDEARTLDLALFNGAATALRSVAAQDSSLARPLLDRLADSPYDAAQWLLYEALHSAGAALGLWSAELLLQGRHRLLTGYMSNAVWGARQVLRSIGASLPNEILHRLEEAVLHLRLPPDEKFSPWDEFTLLSALPEQRLSERGARRLGELRRRHGDADQPAEPSGITAGIVAPPIAVEAARHMNDDQWLRAMKKHGEDTFNWSNHTGGARQQCQVLENQAAEQPARFARFALKINRDINPAYGASLLLGLGRAEKLADPTPVFTAVRHLASLEHQEHDRWLGWPLRKYLASTPLDLVELLLDRALRSSNPANDAKKTDGNADLDFIGINTVRGSAAENLGDLLINDSDGSRTALVAPHLRCLAADPSNAVRACVAHVLHASMRHAQRQAAEAFQVLVTAHDSLLASPRVVHLTVAMAYGNPVATRPVIERMLRSPDEAVRRSGGLLAALGAMEWGMPDLLEEVLASQDGARRQGAAELCAQRLSSTGDLPIAHRALGQFFHDPEEQVREAAATTALALRGKRLRPFRQPLTDLIASPAFSHALPQLLITLDQAIDRVDDLILKCVQRFITVHGADADDLSTSAAADAHEIGELLIRAHAQARSAAKRSNILDVLDQLLLLRAYGVAAAVEKTDRG
ncbi:hypothetical protein AB0O07_07985 [Streptomyces sp. NPDC093085]|uniref:hypothetical protein n=1 Tax=Streptomyces sp. NPDC093085 TaxID=3155068 RepID=UPI0034195EC5